MKFLKNYLAIKRAVDIFLSYIGLISLSPFWFLFSFLIWLEDSGPIFYFQERVGKNGKIFKSIKFRSMIVGAEKDSGPIQAQENDPRVTKFGRIMRKAAMDELPQLINILKGDMSFAGPRALRPEEKEVQDNFTKSIFDYPDFKERSKVRPGLTGVAQVFASRDIDRQHKFKYDIWYIKNRSFLLDIYIIILSLLITFKRRWEIRQYKFSFLARGLKQKIDNQIKK